MGKYKYQILYFNLFDYMGVEAHLEKMAAKGWRFESVIGVFWKFLKSEPKKLKYSVSYLKKHSEFAPAPSEEQMDMEAYCREAGWWKAGNWMQMQIFCTDNPDAVPIETDESLRLGMIHKIVKKNSWLIYGLLLLLFGVEIFALRQMAIKNWIEFLADGSMLLSCVVWMWCSILVIVDIGYYMNWYRRAKKEVGQGGSCPEPKGYRYFSQVSWYVWYVLLLGSLSVNTGGGAGLILIYLAGGLLLVYIMQKVKEYCRETGMSKGANIAVTLVVEVVFVIAITAVIGEAATLFDWKRTGKPELVGFYDVGKRGFTIYEEELPLYIEDLMEVDYDKRSCYRKETSSILLSYGIYWENMLVPKELEPVAMSVDYDVITVKADWLYDFIIEKFYEQEFRQTEEGEQEKMEYRLVYEAGGSGLYRKYCEGLPVAYDWLVLSGNKIIPITIYVDELTEVQMEVMVNALAES